MIVTDNKNSSEIEPKQITFTRSQLSEVIHPLINRESEREHFKEFITRFPIENTRILGNYYGAGGLGKTRLLRLEFKKLAEDNGWEYLYIDLQDSNLQASVETGIEIVYQSLRTLLKLYDIDPTSNQSSATADSNHTKSDSTYSSEIILSAFSKLQKKWIVVLDGLEGDESWLQDFSNDLIEKLIPARTSKNNETFSCPLWLFGSRHEVDLRNSFLDSRILFYKLRPISIGKYRKSLINLLLACYNQELDEKSLGTMVTKLEELYCGLPLALRLILPPTQKSLEQLALQNNPILYLLDQNFSQAKKELTVKNKLDSLKRDLANNIITWIVSSTKDTLDNSQETYPSLNPVMLHLSILRQFDISLFATYFLEPKLLIFKESEQKQIKAKKDLFFAELASFLETLTFVDWEDDWRGFVIPESYRHILYNGLCAANKPVVIDRLHIKAAKLYLQKAKREINKNRPSTISIGIYFLETIYQICNLSKKDVVKFLLDEVALKLENPSASLMPADNTNLSATDNTSKFSAREKELVKEIELLLSHLPSLEEHLHTFNVIYTLRHPLAEELRNLLKNHNENLDRKLSSS